MLGIELRRTGAVVFRPLGRQIERDLRVVVGHHLAGRDVDHRRNGDAAGVVRVAGEVGVPEPLDPQDRVASTGVEVERPAALIVRGATHAHRQHALEAEQSTHDDRAVRPRARPRDDEAVAPRLDREPVPAVGGDPGGQIVRVPAVATVRGPVLRIGTHPDVLPGLSGRYAEVANAALIPRWRQCRHDCHSCDDILDGRSGRCCRLRHRRRRTHRLPAGRRPRRLVDHRQLGGGVDGGRGRCCGSRWPHPEHRGRGRFAGPARTGRRLLRIPRRGAPPGVARRVPAVDGGGALDRAADRTRGLRRPLGTSRTPALGVAAAGRRHRGGGRVPDPLRRPADVGLGGDRRRLGAGRRSAGVGACRWGRAGALGAGVLTAGAVYLAYQSWLLG